MRVHLIQAQMSLYPLLNYCFCLDTGCHVDYKELFSDDEEFLTVMNDDGEKNKCDEVSCPPQFMR